MVRWWTPTLLVVILSLAGCTEPDAPPEAAPCGETLEGCPEDTSATRGGDVAAPFVAHTPDLRAGTAWTYRLDGPWALQERVTVVVAEAFQSGYHFAGATKADLTQDILEGTPLLGFRDAGLNEVFAENVDLKIFSFPFEDGKSWSHGGVDWNATQQEVTTPAGAEEGFVVSGVAGPRSWSFSYAPSVGFLTEGTYTHAERGQLWHFELETVTRQATWAWYEYGTWAWTGTHTNVTQYTVTEDVETVFVQGSGGEGAHGVLLRPAPEALVFEGQGREEWELVVLDAEPGEWVLSSATPPGTTFSLWAVGVRWTDGAVGS